MKNIKFILFIFILLFITVGFVKAENYTSNPYIDCSTASECGFSVNDSSGKRILVFCIDKPAPYSANSQFSDDNDYNSNKQLEINGNKIVDYECNLKGAYYALPELRNDSLFDQNGYLDFSKLQSQLVSSVQYKVSEAEEADSCHNYTEELAEEDKGSIKVKLGSTTFDSSSQEYIVNYTVTSKKVKSGTIQVSTNVGTLSKSNGSGILTIKASDLSDVSYHVNISVSAQVATGIEHDVEVSLKVLTPEVNGKQELAIPTLHRNIVNTYSLDTDSDSLDFKFGSIVVEKVSEKNSSIKLSGAKFKIEHCINESISCSVEPAYDIDGNIVEEKTTLEDGKLVFGKLPYGTYKITEVSSASGYSIGNDSSIIRTISAENNPINITISNIPKNIKISKKAISNEKEIAGAKICIYEYDLVKNKKVEEKAYECFESKNAPYEFYAAPGDYILEETVTPKGYEAIDTGFVFNVSDDFKITLKGVESKFIKVNTKKDEIILYNTPVKEEKIEEEPAKEVKVEDTFKGAKKIYIFIGIILSILGGCIIGFKSFNKKRNG